MLLVNSRPLEINQLVKDYGTFRAVNQVSFNVEPGEIFGLLGPNGAGKTSIISCLVTLEKPTSGELRIFGHDVLTEPMKAKRKVGFVPQELIHHGYFDVEEILGFHSGYFGLWRNRERIHYLLHRLSLYEHRHKKVKGLSGGMKRRLLIAKALVHQPPLLLLDEPTAGVDIELRESLWEFVKELQKEGTSILLTTHYLEEAEELCSRVAILQAGQIRRCGQTKDLIRELTFRNVKIKLRSADLSFEHPLLIQIYEGVAEFSLPMSMSVGELLSDLPFSIEQVEDLQVSEGNLEDALRAVLNTPTPAEVAR